MTSRRRRRRRLLYRNTDGSLVTKAAGLKEGLCTLAVSAIKPVFIPGGKEAKKRRCIKGSCHPVTSWG